MPHVHQNQYNPDWILDSFRKRVTAELLENLFQCVTITGPSNDRAAYLRKIVRNSPAAEANWEIVLFQCDLAGVTVNRHCAFRMGCVQGILLAENIQGPNFVDAALARLRQEQEQELKLETVSEAVAVEV